MYTYMIIMTLLYLPFAYPQGIGDPCIIQCANQQLVSGGCASLADLSCICSSIPYQQAVLGCIRANCPQADLQMAMGIQAQQCGGAATSGSGSSGATSVPTSSGSGSGTATGTPSSVLTNPYGTGGGTTTPTSLSQTGTGIPPTSTGPSGTGAGTGTETSGGSSTSQTQSQNAAPSFGGTLIFMHDIVAVCVVWMGIIVGGALVL